MMKITMMRDMLTIMTMEMISDTFNPLLGDVSLIISITIISKADNIILNVTIHIYHN